MQTPPKRRCARSRACVPALYINLRKLPHMPKAATSTKPEKLGDLPEWNLNDLYVGMDDPALKQDLSEGDAECVAFEQDFKGKLAGMAEGEGAGQKLAEAVKRYERIEDRLGRLYSYASLLYAGDTTDPAR